MVPASSFLKLKHPGINFKPSYIPIKTIETRGQLQAKHIAPSLICIIGIFVQFLVQIQQGFHQKLEMDQQHGDSESTKKNTKSVSAIVNLQQSSLFFHWENTTSAETEETDSDSPSCACAFRIIRKLHHFFSHTAICRPVRLYPLLPPWKFQPNCQSSAANLSGHDTVLRKDRIHRPSFCPME